METKFNLQICTSREQSERLLELGLKKETADMNYTRLSKGDHWTLFIGLPMWYDEIPNEYLLPAWSLHRLLELNLLCCEQHFAFQFHITNVDDAYEYLVSHIEWLIKEGYFNKEYLV
jgi:hypothetical protein